MTITRQLYAAPFIEKRFGLKSGYFRRALNQNTKMNLEAEELYSMLMLKLPDEIADLIADGYISVKIEDDSSVEMFDHVYDLTKQTRIGFYR